MSGLTAEEMAFEAMIESRLEHISSRLNALTQATQHLFSETQDLHNTFQAKAHRMYAIEDNLLRLQGKPGLSNLLLVNGAQPRRGNYKSIGSGEIEEIKMGVKTLRRKFQAAGNVVSTVGWWRHLKDKAAASASGVPLEITATPVVKSEEDAVKTKTSDTKSDLVAKLSIDTSLPAQPQQVLTPSADTAPTSHTLTKPAIISPKTMLSPTSSSTKKRNTLNLQQIFTPPPSATAKQLHQHYVSSPSSQRAHPSLGLYSPPMSPNAVPSATNTNSLMQGLSLRS
ncbi:hypothetical protein BC939DRAFT_461266 [Gamsiella multidivaricata]|uniref:uncharacterized protein n=1 Tax=Gamsiella multidivaricata TaxID=101098 RepID=UPI00221E5D15|nr:uncharacterized protein BC939DRAFT_461266 [Gamsiella multidivaricata]KAG0364672.1 hypothetical protein BGZ54_007276 [Gamsiella multidivaricata]KAI7818991.1 hypothetical protein BC939DRAFT_461266 [Gamsiella multidivaricata]